MLIQQTSRDAYESVNRGNIPIKHQVLNKFLMQNCDVEEEDLFISGNRVNWTCDEIEYKLGGKHQTISATIRSLVKEGMLEDSGFRRQTRSGRRAICWQVVAFLPNNLL
tara:strand:- start:137 stop:463 length:327 start_codon:yes stop_codon:yes gene_type:complete